MICSSRIVGQEGLKSPPGGMWAMAEGVRAEVSHTKTVQIGKVIDKAEWLRGDS